ncbi:MAG: histidinol-phosphatase [Bacteroides sp.]|nr:histidinol-phosphatase [Bacteroides sp.]
MNLTNYHSHSLYCDGRAGMEDFVRFALSEGFTSYGFSSHAPLPFSTAWTMEWDRMDDYLAEFHRLKKKYAPSIELYLGLEIDYLNEDSNPSIARFRELPLDYRIGSVHLLYNAEGEVVDIDVPADTYRKIVDEQFDGDLEHVVRLYYGRLRRMLELGGFDIVGHADKMHYNASCYRPGLLDEPWYDQLVWEYFEDIARRGYQMEINTKAYHELGTFYPNERYFPFLLDLGVRVQVNSDAHYPERINNGRPEALEALKKAGYQSLVERYDGEWKDIPIL